MLKPLRLCHARFALGCLLLLCGILLARELSAAETGTAINFDIKRQPLSTALLDFSYQADVQIVMPGYLAEGLLSKSVVGLFSITQALNRLLAKSHLQFEFSGENTIVIRRKPADNAGRRQRRPYQDVSIEQLEITAEGQRDVLQDISVSATAFSGEDLESRGVTKADELQPFVPGLTVEAAQVGSSEISIRGVGNSNDDLSTQPSVGIYVDDIYIPRQGPANMALYDLERVAVLRGPQPILYSRNALGGALIYVTRQPTADFEARYLLDVGNEGRLNNVISVNGALADNIYGQFAVASFLRDGIMDNLNARQPSGNNTKSLSGRVGLRMVSSDNVEFLFAADNEDTDQQGPLYSIGPQGGFRFAPGLPAVAASNPLRTANTTFTGGETLDTEGLMLRANIKHARFNAAYILGRRSHEINGLYDLDMLPEDLASKALYEDSGLYSLEMRLTSRQERQFLRAGEVKWLAGVYANSESAQSNKVFAVPGLSLGSNMWRQEVENENYSAYGQVTYALSAALQMTVGARYSADLKSSAIAADAAMPAVDNPYLHENFDFSDRQAWRRFTPKLSFAYEQNPETLYFASLTTAYKPGGYLGMPADRASAAVVFDEEQVESLEVGMKTKLLANRIKFNLSGFVSEYTDLQVSLVDAFGSVSIANAPKTVINGFELETQARFTTNLRLSLGLSFLNARFRDFIVSLDGERLDRAGERVPRVPDATVNFSAEYFFPETSYGAISLRMDAIYSDEAEDIRGDLAWASYRNYNLWLDFIPNSGIWQLSAWIRNVTDEAYFQASSPGVTNDSMAIARKLEPPRLFGLSFKYYW